jgi:hypothetical protein
MVLSSLYLRGSNLKSIGLRTIIPELVDLNLYKNLLKLVENRESPWLWDFQIVIALQ